MTGLPTVFVITSYSIHYTKLYELATYSFFPIAAKFCAAGGVELEQSDISLAGRVLAAMGKGEDELSKLGELCVKPVV